MIRPKGTVSVSILTGRKKPKGKIVPFNVGDWVQYRTSENKLFKGRLFIGEVKTVAKLPNGNYRYNMLSPKGSRWSIDHNRHLLPYAVEELTVYEIQ